MVFAPVDAATDNFVPSLLALSLILLIIEKSGVYAKSRRAFDRARLARTTQIYTKDVTWSNPIAYEDELTVSYNRGSSLHVSYAGLRICATGQSHS